MFAPFTSVPVSESEPVNSPPSVISPGSTSSEQEIVTVLKFTFPLRSNSPSSVLCFNNGFPFVPLSTYQIVSLNSLRIS